MKARLLGFLLLFSIMGVGANAAWTGEVSSITPLENGVYRVTATAGNKFTRDTDKLKAQAMEAATRFCAKDGKLLRVVSVTENKSLYLIGSFAQVTLTFKALSPGDPELSPATEAVVERPSVPASPATEQLYADIMRLNELRKQGLLTEAEFQVEKKKVLNRFK